MKAAVNQTRIKLNSTCIVMLLDNFTMPYIIVLAGISLTWSMYTIFAKHHAELKAYEADCNQKLKVLHERNMELEQQLREQEDRVTSIGITAAVLSGVAVVGHAVLEALKEMR